MLKSSSFSANLAPPLPALAAASPAGVGTDKAAPSRDSWTTPLAICTVTPAGSSDM